MRVVAGTAKGRRLVAPAGLTTRPTSDRVREAIFNTLYSLRDIEGATVLDLFAGSGAMGIEALSRGAAKATFVDSDRAAIAAINANLSVTGFEGDQADVRQANAETYAADRVDIVFADPPYAFGGWQALLEGLAADLVAAESDRPIDPAAGWGVLKVKHYGTTVVTLMSRSRSHP